MTATHPHARLCNAHALCHNTCPWQSLLSPHLRSARESVHGGFPKSENFFGGPQNKDYSALGSISGYPYFGELLP